MKKFISREGLVRLGLFLVLLTAAWIFDTFHQAVPQEKENHAGQEEAAVPGCHFFCTFQGTLSLKAPVQKTVLKKSFQDQLSRLVVSQLKARIAFLLKAEVQKQPHSFLILRNLLHLRYAHSGSPDDFPLF